MSRKTIRNTLKTYEAKNKITFDRVKIKDLYKSGLSVRKVAQEIGVSYYQLRYFLKNTKIILRKGNYSLMSVQKVRALYEGGITQIKIAKLFKVTSQGVSQFMKRHNIKARNRGRRPK